MAVAVEGVLMVLLGGAGGLAWKRYFSRRVSETGGGAAVQHCFARRRVDISTPSAQCAAGKCCRDRMQSQPVVEALASSRACRQSSAESGGGSLGVRRGGAV